MTRVMKETDNITSLYHDSSPGSFLYILVLYDVDSN